MSGWGNNGQQGQGWGNQGQGFGQQGQGFGQQGQGFGQQGQGFGQQGQGFGQQGQGFGQQGQGQGQGQWGSQQQGWNGQQPNNSGWGNQPNNNNTGNWGTQGQQQGNWGNQPNNNSGWNNNQGFNQTAFIPAQNQLYRFLSGLNPGFSLDVSQSKHEFNKLIIYQANNGGNQKFSLKPVGNGKYGIFCSQNGLTVEARSQMKGAKVFCSQPNKQQNEFWELVPVQSAKYQGKNAFHLRCFGKNLDVEGGKCQNETDCILWDHNGGDNQVWIIEPTY